MKTKDFVIDARLDLQYDKENYLYRIEKMKNFQKLHDDL